MTNIDRYLEKQELARHGFTEKGVSGACPSKGRAEHLVPPPTHRVVGTRGPQHFSSTGLSMNKQYGGDTLDHILT